jgi:hypothetical protein
MVIVAEVELQDDYIVPLPFELIPSDIKGHEKIIVAIDDIPPSKLLLQKVAAFYGSEDCEVLMGKIPPGKEDKTVICVSAQCIVDRALSGTDKSPPADISPLWTKDRFGITAEEAIIVSSTSKEMNRFIHQHMIEYRQRLDNLNIKLDLRSIQNIEECNQVIRKASQQLEKTKKNCRWMCAETVARYIRHNFPVNAWAEEMMEPAVFFVVSKEHSDNQAVVIGSSVEGVFNEIEPANADRFFDVFVGDASVFPIVMDVSFVNGKRIYTKEEYKDYIGGKS